MRERVNVIYGPNPILIVVPHGPDDINTAFLGQKAAEIARCNAVINQGFECSDYVDTNNDLADCNRVDHAVSEVVYDEFLKPILKIKNQVLATLSSERFITPLKNLTIFHIHGVGNIAHKEAGEHVGVIVGYGLGKEYHSFSCKKWRRNVFIEAYSKFDEVFEGVGGGQYAGRSSNNMNQYFRKYEDDDCVDSLQLEFPYSTRDDEDEAYDTAEILALSILHYLKFPKETEEWTNLKRFHKFI